MWPFQLCTREAFALAKFRPSTVSEKGRCALPEIRNNNSQSMNDSEEEAEKDSDKQYEDDGQHDGDDEYDDKKGDHDGKILDMAKTS